MRKTKQQHTQNINNTSNNKPSQKTGAHAQNKTRQKQHKTIKHETNTNTQSKRHKNQSQKHQQQNIQKQQRNHNYTIKTINTHITNTTRGHTKHGRILQTKTQP